MDKKELLEQANKAYREGNPILGDAEYDELEKELGLENENEIGEKHSPEMTVKHPFIMGSLSKVQVHEVEGKVDWEEILKSIQSYTKLNSCIITPKYDGCSFEVYIKNGKIESCSTRGDGYWGKDISKYVVPKIPEKYLKLEHDEYVLRGEILIKKSIFEKKYKDNYVNTRAFVAGITGSDDASQEMIDDLSIVIYDYRTYDEGNWYDIDWTYLPDSDILPKKSFYTIFDSAKKVEEIYNTFDEYRKECEYSLDGFVIKSRGRRGEFVNPRPKDCVAIKFIPMVKITKIENIEWSLGKTGEYTPIVYYSPIIMDGKTCMKASGHNYGWLKEKGVAIGTEVIISMAGDIIPYIYKIINPIYNGNLSLPENVYIDGCHLMKNLSEEDKLIEEFRNSCLTLKIPGMGESQVQKIIDHVLEDDRCIENDFLGLGGNKSSELPFNILLLDPEVIDDAIGGKNAQKIIKEFKNIIKNISLGDIIESCNFKLCGKKLSKEIANYLLGEKYDFESKAGIGYNWIYNKNSENYKKFFKILKHLNMDDLEFFKKKNINKEFKGEKTYIIMTGEPNNYSTKGEFLAAHPEYEETTSWKKVQIVFTNSLDSNTGKMKKAKEKGIVLRIY